MHPAKKMRRCVGVGVGSPPNRAPPPCASPPPTVGGQRNATNKEKNMHHLLPAPCTRTPPNIYPANDDDNYSDGGDGDSNYKMH